MPSAGGLAAPDLQRAVGASLTGRGVDRLRTDAGRVAMLRAYDKASGQDVGRGPHAGTAVGLTADLPGGRPRVHRP